LSTGGVGFGAAHAWPIGMARRAATVTSGSNVFFIELPLVVLKCRALPPP
jgi:hypothetical protein